MSGSPEQNSTHRKLIQLALAVGLLAIAMLGGLIWGQLRLHQTLKTLDEKVATLQAAGSSDEHNLEMQAQFNMMASRLSALQADLTQVKINLLQP